MQAQHWLPTQCDLGESPVWDERQQCLYYIDISAAQIHKLCLKTEQTTLLYQGQAPIGAVALTNRPELLLYAEGSRLCLLDLETGRVQPQTTAVAQGGRHRYNDGVCDAAGRFICGLMDVAHAPLSGRLDVYERRQGQWRSWCLLDGLGLPNGLAWSPDACWLYFVDSTAQAIYKGRYDGVVGRLDAVQLFVKTPADLGRPDGLAIDELGQVWVSQFMGGCVLCYGADGVLRQQVSVPAPRVTSLAFVPAALVVTTAQFGLSVGDMAVAPQSGDVFRFTVPTKGLVRPYFQLD